MPTVKSLPPLEERIKARAHEIWLNEGCPDGRELAHWQQAEAEIGAAGQTPAKPRAAAARTTRARAKIAAE